MVLLQGSTRWPLQHSAFAATTGLIKKKFSQMFASAGNELKHKNSADFVDSIPLSMEEILQIRACHCRLQAIKNRHTGDFGFNIHSLSPPPITEENVSVLAEKYVSILKLGLKPRKDL